MVVAHHAAQAYGPTGGQWLVKDTQNLSWLKMFLSMNAAYLMGMYFFIAGYFSSASLGHKNRYQFVNDRLRRLLLPVLVITLFVFVPMYGFLDSWQHPWHFYLTEYYFNKPPLAVGHLWFLLLLLAFSVLLSVVCSGIPQHVVFSRRLIGTVLILLAAVTVWTREIWPVDTWRTIVIPVEPAHLPQYITMFFLGYCYRHWQWEQQINRIEISAYAILGISAMALVEVWGATPWLTTVIETFFGLAVVLWLPAITKKIPVHRMNTVRMLSENNYGIYLFHLFFVLAFQFILLPVAIPASMKWLVVTFLGFSSALLISIIFRRSSLIRKII